MRNQLKKYYKNLIDDIQDENVREQMLDRLEAIDEEVFSLDYDINEVIENQEYIEDEIEYDYETFLRSVRA